MLMPKRTKYRKAHRGRMKGKARRGNFISYGDFGLQALEPCWVTSNQIEAARVALTRYCKRMGKVWIKIFPDKPVSKKPAETRMGKGKGAPEFWVAVVKPGRILFELSEVPSKVAREAMRLADGKLPLKCKFVIREGYKEMSAKEARKFAEASAAVPEETKEDSNKEGSEESTETKSVEEKSV